MWTSLNKKIFLFISVILAIGIISGIIFLIFLNEASLEIIFLNINEWLQSIESSHINNIIPHIVILSSLFILSLFIIGIPFVYFLYFIMALVLVL